jgi:putative endonuclease
VLAEWPDSVDDAIRREKILKAWKRAWKIELIEATNPTWRDLWDDLAIEG